MQLYGERYEVEGGMYRGEPPMLYYTPSFVLDSIMMNNLSKMQALPDHPFNKFIGIQGASSTNTAADGTSTTVETSATASAPTSQAASTSYDVAVATPVVQWTDPRGNAPDGEPGFILPNARSTQKGVNNNPQKRDYIFGNATCGRGYYHVNTREAYQILEKRIKARKRRIEEDIAFAKCCQCGFSKETPYILQKERELRDLIEYETIVQARAKADIPIGTVGIPVTLAGDPRRDNYYTDDGQWLFPYAMYTAGGGCGATGAHAGGCGGKTCC
jgi:hypothetical protein